MLFKVFVYNNRYFLYDTCQNYLLEIQKEHFVAICHFVHDQLNENKILNELHDDYMLDILRLHNRGFFKNDIIEKVENPHLKYIKGLLDGGINDLVLQVTQRCNFNCRYCLYAGKEQIERTHFSKDMKKSVAFKAVDYLFEHSYDANNIHISFYGGEPLLNLDLIRRVVDYAKDKFALKKISFSLTTNGSLINDECVDFFCRNDFKVSISFDGPMHIQNKHRKTANGIDGTFSIVYSNIRRIKDNNPIFFNNNLFFMPVVIDDEDYQVIKDFFLSENISSDKITPLKANLNGVDYHYSFTRINNSSLKYTKMDSGNINEQAFNSLYNIYKNKSKISNIWHHNGQCIPGVQRLFVDVDGSFYPCEKIIENPAFRIGSLFDGIKIETVEKMTNIGQLTEDDCKQCWALRFCELCISQCLDCDNNCITRDAKIRACKSQREKALWMLKNIIDRER